MSQKKTIRRYSFNGGVFKCDSTLHIPLDPEDPTDSLPWLDDQFKINLKEYILCGKKGSHYTFHVEADLDLDRRLVFDEILHFIQTIKQMYEL